MAKHTANKVKQKAHKVVMAGKAGKTKKGKLVTKKSK